MSVDLRTRTDAQPELVDVDALLDGGLDQVLSRLDEDPERLCRRPVEPLLVEVGDRAVTLWREGSRARARAGHPAAAEGRFTHVRLTEAQLADLVADLVTPVGLWTAGSLDLVAGPIGRFLDWWLVLRAALDGHHGEDPAHLALPDDLGRTFTLGDDPTEMRGFLEQAGYLHLAGVFTEAEMAAVSADMDRAAPTYQQGDGRSWWAKTTGGDRLVRMEGFERHSPTTAALLEDPRLLGLADIAGCGHERRRDGSNQIEALFKPLGVTEGISDIPWHKDCSLGRHSYECCSLTVGISVTGGGPTTGQLRVIAGSHRVLMWPALLDVTTLGLPEVALPTRTGDVTIHLSCTLHMAQPPTERERRVMYTDFRLPAIDEEAARAAQRRLFVASREAAPLTTSQPSTV